MFWVLFWVAQLQVPLGLDAFVPVPDQNPLSSAKVELGRLLFFDKRLSRDHTVSCATCHVPEKAFSDGQRVAIGVEGRQGMRNSPSLFNRAYSSFLFWDGRRSALEEQTLDAIQNPLEMDLSLQQLEERLFSKQYRGAFRRVFAGEPTAPNAAKALASYVRTLFSGDSAFDRFEHGDRTALSAAAQRGLSLFRVKGNCAACHTGPLFTDGSFHNTGVSWEEAPLDYGRFNVSRKEADRGKFKTPSLRDVDQTAPYMHNGSLATLEEVLDFYNHGGKPNPNLDRELRPLNLTTEEKSDLIHFLRALSGAGAARKAWVGAAFDIRFSQ